VVPVRPHAARRAPPFAPVTQRERGDEERHIGAVIAAIQHERADDRERDPRRQADLHQENLRGLPAAERVAIDDPEEEEVGEDREISYICKTFREMSCLCQLSSFQTRHFVTVLLRANVKCLFASFHYCFDLFNYVVAIY
jgi:hypothetical protein